MSDLEQKVEGEVAKAVSFGQRVAAFVAAHPFVHTVLSAIVGALINHFV